MFNGGMARLARNVPRLLLTLLIACPSGSAQITEMKVFDQYGDEVGVLYYGSTIVFSCECSTLCKDANAEMKLMLHRTGTNDKKSLASSSTKVKSPIEFKIKVDENFQFGAYYCLVKNAAWQNKSINYHLCRNAHSVCPHNATSINCRFCVVRAKGTNTCTSLTTDECKIHSAPTCRGVEPNSHGVASLCEAYSSNHNVTSMVQEATMCQSAMAISFHLWFIEYPLGTNIFKMNQSIELRIKCTDPKRLINVKLCEKNSSGVVMWCENTTCDAHVPSKKFENRTKFSRTKLIVSGQAKSDKKTFSSYVFINVFGHFGVKLNLPQGECVENDTVTEFDCKFEGLYGHPTDFSVIMEIQRMLESGPLIINTTDNIFGLRNQMVQAPGNYRCVGVVWYTSCSPFETKPYRVQHDVNLLPSCVPIDQRGVIIKERKVEVLSKAVLYSIVAVSIFLSVLSIALIVAFAYRRWKKSRREPELIRTLDEDDAINREHILMTKTIKELTNCLMEPSDNFGAARKYVAHWFGTLEKDNDKFVKTQLAAPVKESKYADLCCYKHSQIRYLHVNRLNDWRCNPVYLSTAPTRKEFARFWEMIALERIGTIVWVGGFVEKGEARIEPYLSLVQGRILIYKDDTQPSLKVTVKTVGVFQHEHRYTTYSVRVKVEGLGHRDLKAMVTIMHVPSWPAMDIPPLYQAYNLNEDCTVIESYQKKRNSWPGLLFHCNNGVQKSAAMLVLYICRQIYVERKKVNLMGVIRYVRASRFGAFSYAPGGYIQVPVILAILGAVDKSVKEDKLTENASVMSSMSAMSKSISTVSSRSEMKPPKSAYLKLSTQLSIPTMDDRLKKMKQFAIAKGKASKTKSAYLKLSTQLSIPTVDDRLKKVKQSAIAKGKVSQTKTKTPTTASSQSQDKLTLQSKQSKQAKSPASQNPTSKSTSPIVSPYLYA